MAAVAALVAPFRLPLARPGRGGDERGVRRHMRDKLPPRLETSANAPGTTARAPTTTNAVRSMPWPRSAGSAWVPWSDASVFAPSRRADRRSWRGSSAPPRCAHRRRSAGACPPAPGLRRRRRTRPCAPRSRRCGPSRWRSCSSTTCGRRCSRAASWASTSSSPSRASSSPRCCCARPSAPVRSRCAPSGPVARGASCPPRC